MAVLTFEIKRRRPFANAISFGEVGPYEQLEGTVYFTFNPDHPANKVITDLVLAPRDSNGLVRGSSDFRILKPVEPQQGNHRILLDILNRGRVTVLHRFNSTERIIDPKAELDPGDGFLMRQGYTLVQCGWQYDIPPESGLMRMDVPDAIGTKGPMSGKIVFTFQPNTYNQIQKLFPQEYQPYLPSNLDEPEAILTVRDYEAAAPEIVPRDQWSFSRLEDNRVVPDASHIYTASGFMPGKIYHVVYTTTGAPVVGMGFLAVRDIVSFLRYGSVHEGNPCADEIQYVYTFGSSQSGRFLRQFLYLGLNQDENKRIVFDGLIAHIAGGRRGEFNRRFGQLTTLPHRTLSYFFPFSDVEQTDPETGRSEGLLSQLVDKGSIPKVFMTNSATEYWGSFASLIHTDVLNKVDIVPSESVRTYLFSGTQHGGGNLLLSDTALDGTRMEQPLNIVDYRPLLRSLLVRLDKWVTSGASPPPSKYPRISDGTLVSPESIAKTFESIPRVSFPAYLYPLSRRDYQSGMEKGIEEGLLDAPLLEVGKKYTNLVPDVDDDGNELGGISLPDISVPLATYTGWNLRHPDIGGQGQLGGLSGSTIPFSATIVDRKASADSRQSIEERYTSKEDYLERVREAAQRLVDEEYLLLEDIDDIVEKAALRYELLRG